MISFKAKRVTITSALPYVNGVKHLGNLVGSILPADVFHRWLDIMGIDNVYVCGTDDHGTAVEIAAAEEGLSFEKYAEKYFELQKEIYTKWNIDFSFFGKTSSESNKEITQDIFLSIYENGYIKKDKLTTPYCTIDKRYLPDRYIIGTCPNCGYERARGDQCEKCAKVLDPEDLLEPRCALCGKDNIEFRKEEHLFLNLPLLEGKLRSWIEEQHQWPDNTRNLALGWLKEGLKPRCITRNLRWGIPVPLQDYKHLVFYVWFDAPIGYISITKDGFHAGAIRENWKHYWKDSQIYHFIGKDNIPFHAIIWPSILLAARDSEERDTNYQLPYFVAGYEYLNWEGRKFSTSQGIGLFSDEALELFPADYWRFYLLSILPESKDSNFDWQDFHARINNELIANFGNLFYRVTYFIEKFFDGKIPHAKTGEDEELLFQKLRETKLKVEQLVEDVKLREALQEILALANATNKYFQDKKPWASVKTDKKEAGTTLFAAANVLRGLSVLLYPYIPQSSDKALKALNSGNRRFSDIDSIQLTEGEPIKAEILFKKIEKEEIDRARKYISKYAKLPEKTVKESVGDNGQPDASGKNIKNVKDGAGNGKSNHALTNNIDKLHTVNGMLPIDEFKKVELRVGTITAAKNHPAADKLLILEVDLGDEKRQVVAGLRFKYKASELEGEQVIVATNLEQKELRGVLSQGMILATEDGTILAPIARVKNGERIM